jgi:hypothetical protein
MFARSTTIREIQHMDEGIAHIRDTVLPTVQQMSGCVGLSLLVDRDGARCIATTAWADESAMHATAESVKEMRDRAAEVFGGQATVEGWEIALLHRRHQTHEGTCTRVTWTRGDPDRMEAGFKVWKSMVLPGLDELPGFCSVSLMAHRPSGRTATTVTYDSREEMGRATQQSVALREEVADAAGAEITEIATFDLVLAHLRVPEIV